METEHLLTALPASSRALDRTTRALQTLTAGNRTVLRAIDEDQLLKDMCASIVQYGGYIRAGVVYACDDVAKSIQWKTWVGSVAGHVQIFDVEWLNAKSFSYQDSVEGQTAVAVAIRTGRPCVGRHILDNPVYELPRLAVFRDQACRDGYRSVTAFPISCDGKIFGALFMAAAEPDAFDAEEVKLLEEMAGDLSYGIKTLRLREQHRVAQEQMRELAFLDCKTGLANRTRHLDVLSKQLDNSRTYGKAISLLHLNIGKFNDVGNVFGYKTADRLLDETVSRLKLHLIKRFPIARVGDATFSVLITNLSDEDTMVFSTDLLRLLNEPVEASGVAIDAGVHGGLLRVKPQELDAEAVFRQANVALFYGKPVSQLLSVFTASNDEEHTTRLLLMCDLRHAVGRQELRLFCQPKVNLATGQIIGGEILVRWQHPNLGIVNPGAFIRLAEQSGLISEVTKWIIEQSFEWLSKWQRSKWNDCMSINLSAYDLLIPSFIPDIQKLIIKWGIKPQLVEFELTETALIDDPLVALQILTKLKEIGVKLSIDDFGTGYSSLSYLQKFPFDLIKIDSSFVIPMIHSTDSAAIVKSTIELGHILGRKVVAEGVECAEVLNRLREQKCDIVQGYYFSKPIPIETFGEWRSNWRGINNKC